MGENIIPANQMDRRTERQTAAAPLVSVCQDRRCLHTVLLDVHQLPLLSPLSHTYKKIITLLLPMRFYYILSRISALSALTLLVGRQEGHPARKKSEWWGSGMVIGLERGADLHMAKLMPLPLTVSCFSKIQIGFTFLVPAHLGSPGKGPLNVYV